MFNTSGYGNGHHREEPESLQAKLDSVKRAMRSGDDLWRNTLRKRYLERRLRKLGARD